MVLTGRGIAIGFAAGVGIGGAGCYIYLSRFRREERKPRPDGIELHKALKYGIPITEVVEPFDGFVTAFDFRTKNPKWVMEHVTEETAFGNADRSKSDFHEDKNIDEWLRSKLDDYKGSGYDRGHMAPAADFRSSQQAMDQTFTMNNISPQVGKGFNRDYWSRLEQFIRGLTKRCEEVHVVTGPLWLPSLDSEGRWSMKHPLIGQPPSLVSVPTHFYKVVAASGCSAAAAKRGGGAPETAVSAFVMPNAAIDARTPLTAFVVPLEALEAVSGTRFFPSLLTNERRHALDDAAVGWRRLGLQQMSPFERQSFLADGGAMPHGDLPALASGHTASRQAADLVRLNDKVEVLPPDAADVGADGDALVLPRTRPGQGVVHLCELEACQLPREINYDNREQHRAGSAPPRR